MAKDCGDYSASYVKKHDEPLPIKWMVCIDANSRQYNDISLFIGDRIFTWQNLYQQIRLLVIWCILLGSI